MRTDNQRSKQQMKNISLDLNLVRCQTSQNTRQALPSTCRNLAQLSKLLKMKNKRGSLMQKRTQEKKEQLIQSSQLAYLQEDLVMLKMRVREQKQHVVEQLIKRQKMRVQSSLVELRNYDKYSKELSEQKVPICEYMQFLGRREQLKICKSFNMSNQSNYQDLQDLVQTFQYLVNISEPIKKPTPSEQNQPKIDLQIYQFRETFQLIQKIRNQTQDNEFSLLDFFLQKYKINDICKKAKEDCYFEYTLDILNKFSKKSPFAPKKRIIVQGQKQQIFQSILAFREDQKQNKFLSGSLDVDQKQFWQKICFLFSRGREQEYNIEVHLRYKKERNLIEHFYNKLNGKSSNFKPTLSLYHTDKYYREFILLLQCRYLKYCIQSQSQDLNKMIYCAFRQISILKDHHQSTQLQTHFLKDSICKLFKLLKAHLISNDPNKIIKLSLSRLFALGEYAQSLELLYAFKKITIIQYALLLSMLYQFDIKHSRLLFYQPSSTLISYKRILIEMAKSVNRLQAQDFLSIVSVIAPAFIYQDSDAQFVTQLLTENLVVFQYLIDCAGFENVGRRLLLKSGDIYNILISVMQKHKRYAYCLQLALSTCIQLTQISNLLSTQNRLSQAKEHYLYNGKNIFHLNNRIISKFQNLNLKLLQPIEHPLLLPQVQRRLDILVKSYKHLAKVNLSLLRSGQQRQQKYEELSFINEIYQKLGSKNGRNLIWKHSLLVNMETMLKYQQQLDQCVNMLILTFTMVKIKIYIKNSIFEQIVDVLNCLREEISNEFTSTVANLESLYNSPSEIKDLLFIFLGDIVQSILVLKRWKPKVIKINRTKLRIVCQIVYSLLTQIKSNQTEGKDIFQQLQKVRSELNIYPT